MMGRQGVKSWLREGGEGAGESGGAYRVTHTFASQIL